jgi:hypothetical protein
MTNELKALATLVLSVTTTVGIAQTTANSGDTPRTAHHPRQLSKKPSVESQIEGLRDEMQTQIQ